MLPDRFPTLSYIHISSCNPLGCDDPAAVHALSSTYRLVAPNVADVLAPPS